MKCSGGAYAFDVWLDISSQYRTQFKAFFHKNDWVCDPGLLEKLIGDAQGRLERHNGRVGERHTPGDEVLQMEIFLPLDRLRRL